MGGPSSQATTKAEAATEENNKKAPLGKENVFAVDEKHGSSSIRTDKVEDEEDDLVLPAPKRVKVDVASKQTRAEVEKIPNSSQRTEKFKFDSSQAVREDQADHEVDEQTRK